MTSFITDTFKFITSFFKPEETSISFPNYNYIDFNYDNHPKKGSIGSCEAGHKLDRIILAMLYIKEIDDFTSNKIWHFCQKNLNKAKEYHKLNSVIFIKNDVKKEIINHLRQEMIYRVEDLIKLHCFSHNHPLINHLYGYIITITSNDFIPTPTVKRMTFDQIENEYSLNNLFHNKQLKQNKNYNDIMKSIIMNSCKTKPLSYNIKQQIKKNTNEDIIKFLNEYTKENNENIVFSSNF